MFLNAFKTSKRLAACQVMIMLVGLHQCACNNVTDMHVVQAELTLVLFSILLSCYHDLCIC